MLFQLTQKAVKFLRGAPFAIALGGALFVALAPAAHPASPPASAHFKEQIQPILTQYCYDCHADGANKGGVTLDEFTTEAALTGNPELWAKVLKNVRADIMPPQKKKERPSAGQKEILAAWIKTEALGLDPKNPDPGRVTVRRLNRIEYHATIRDLMDYNYKVEEEFPPDDTGYGFDNIGDVLTVSPLLLEKYMQAAESIVNAAVPVVGKAAGEKLYGPTDFKTPDKGTNADRLSFYREVAVSKTFQAKEAGTYHIVLDFSVRGDFNFDPGRAKVVFKAGDKELYAQEFGWENGKKIQCDFHEKWEAGDHRLAIEIHPLVPLEKKKTAVDFRLTSVLVQGPIEPEHWSFTKNYKRFFTRDQPPAGAAERRKYAREVLGQFATKAFRRPVDARTLDRLVKIAEAGYQPRGKSFEEGIRQAMIAVLSSPRFLFRVEEALPAKPDATVAMLDEHALASRLSYFLWSTMPDAELSALAAKGELRKNMTSQISRMLADPKANAFVENFTGQWLQLRDIEGININPRAVLRREGLQSRDGEIDGKLRRAIREETESYFRYVLREDRSVLEFLDSDYTFVNETLAKHYGITNVTGGETRRIQLAADSPRGGLLSQASILVVTSNPTRTSPVKRGLFLLDNIVGLPPPPPPPDIPQLEESEKQFKDREPTLREVMEIHRSKPLCSSCHSRMDPLGMALENFNALGMWRDQERKQTIDASGTLITGESFRDIRELKRVLKENHKTDFYRCLTEKLLTYAIGRGLEYYDAATVDEIVERLEKNGGHFSALLNGVIESAPFQKRRNTPKSAVREMTSNPRETLKDPLPL
jgi:hypothetical protein